MAVGAGVLGICTTVAVLESVFALPGLGRLALGAISARDLPVVQGVKLFVASSIVLINFAVDVAYGFLDPRIRYE